MTKKSFHLRWNNHLQNLQTLFENLYNEQSLIDVTLSCSDGTLYAHKLVLSACSPYFEQIFKTNPSKHPIMILKGIKSYEMQVLLQYMYVGSVDVGEDDLEMLLDTATELQIKGLVQCNEEGLQNPFNNVQDKMLMHDKSKQRASPSSMSPAAKDDLKWQAEILAKPSTSGQKEYGFVNKQTKELQLEGIPIKMERNQTEDSEIEFEPVFKSNGTNESTPSTNGGYHENSEEELRDPLEHMEEISLKKLNDSNGDVNYFCHLCSRAFLNKGSHHRHMMTHAGVKPHNCTFCNQSFLRLSHLQRHIRVHTGERPYSCTQCPRQFARSDKLRQHYIIQHNGLTGDKGPKPRGRPRKHPMIFPPTSSGSYSTEINNMYPVSISPVPVSMSSVTMSTL